VLVLTQSVVPPVLTEALYGVAKFLEANAKVIPKLSCDQFLPDSLQSSLLVI
jgi:hypothetical protein